jgi:Mce-associated membrane protein
MSMRRRLRNRRPEIPAESEAATEQTDTELTTEESAAEPEAATEETSPEAEEFAEAEESAESAESAESTESEAEAAEAEESEGVERGPSRLGLGWAVGIAAALLLFAAGIGFGGWRALVAHQESQTLARNNAAALEAAKVCVAATQAPDTNAMAASEQKIIDCGTDVYRSQALLYTSMLVQAYQAANVHVQVSDERAAVERNDSDGSVLVLVALRVAVSNDQAQNQESGYRLRVKMQPVDGQYKIAKLDQVTK